MKRKHFYGYLLGILVIALGCFVCTINDDAGNPVITDETEPQKVPRITIVPFNPVKSADTLTINIFVWADTVDTTPIANAPVSVSVSHGWLSDGSITTNSSGYASVKFSDTLTLLNEETRQISFAYLTAKASANIIISNQTTTLQTHFLTISANPYILAADGASQSVITVKVKNEKFNPIAGAPISFTTNSGDITASDTTDISGVATALLTSERRNRIAQVTATMVNDTAKKAKIEVEFSGVNITTSVKPESIVPNGIDSSIITMTLQDAADNSIYGERVLFSKKATSTAIITVFDTVTDTRGQAKCKLSGTGTGKDTIWVKAAGDSAIAVISYSSNYIAFDTTPSIGTIHSYCANGIDSTLITITYYAGDKITKISGAAVAVSVTSGAIDTLFTLVGTTDINGQIAFYLKNPDFATTATITVTATKTSLSTSSSFDIYFRADKIARIELTGTPEVISTGGDAAAITAVAFDDKGNLVKDEVISFKLASGPGAGERLSPPTSTTNASGIAISSLVSGNSPSKQQDVWVVGSSFSGIKSNVIKFTIAGAPAHVAFGKDVGDIVEYSDGTYGLNCAGLVTDINNNPVKDGTDAIFSLKISGYYIFCITKKFIEDSLKYEKAPSYPSRLLVFEDINNNFVNDPGETDHTGYPFYRGEDIVWFAGDRNYNPGPPFYDRNGNGRRDYNPAYSGYEPPEPYTYVLIGGVVTLVFGDLDGDYVLDTAEYLVDGSVTDAQYESDLDFIPGYGYPDIDWNNNMIADPDPTTTVKINRVVKTTEGKSPNQIVYLQSKALRLHVTVWVESNGISSLDKENFQLPIEVGDYPFFNPLQGKKYY